MRGLLSAALLGGVTGCGLGLSGLGPAGTSGDGGAAQDGSNTSSGGGDAGANEASGGDASSDTTASCAMALPTGWTLVAYETGRAACPAGLGMAHPEYAGATVSAGACTCACNVTTQPTCDVGTLSTQWTQTAASPSSPCPNTGGQIAFDGPGCVSLPGNASVPQGFSAEALPPAGGMCTGVVMPDPTKLSLTPAQYCDVPAASAEAVCEGTTPSGFTACIVADGNVPCPSGPFTMQLEVDDGDELVCPTCDACSVTGSCANAQVTFFSDGSCTGKGMIGTLPCTGLCAGTGNLPAGGNVGGAEYSAQVQATCSASSSGTPGVSPSGPHTLCCR
jgi:hypothetical protein